MLCVQMCFDIVIMVAMVNIAVDAMDTASSYHCGNVIATVCEQERVCEQHVRAKTREEGKQRIIANVNIIDL